MVRWWPVHTGKSGARVWRGDGLHRKGASPSAIAAEAVAPPDAVKIAFYRLLDEFF